MRWSEGVYRLVGHIGVGVRLAMGCCPLDPGEGRFWGKGESPWLATCTLLAATQPANPTSEGCQGG